jgi:TRAP-type C4-dicarboxylate transport system permease small subunit
MKGGIVSTLDSISLLLHKVGTTVCIPAMTLIVTAEVIFRYFLKSPIIWSHEGSGLLLFLVFFLSLTYCWDARRHIHMDVVYERFKGRFKAFADMVVAIAGIIFFGPMGVQSLRDIPYMIATHETGEEILIPLWTFRALIAFCCFLLLGKLVVHLLYAAKNFTAKGSAK